MDNNVFLWVMGVAIPLMFSGVIWLTVRTEIASRDRKDLASRLDKLIVMHEKPDEYGFGTSTTNRIIEDNTRAINTLIHYIKWLGSSSEDKAMNRGSMPPPMG